MNELQLYYAGGNKVDSDYSGQPRKSLGGIITDTKVPQNLNALFGKVSLQMLNQGSEDYRMIFLRNDGAEEVAAVAAIGTITIIDNSLITGDTISIQGNDLVEGVDFTAGGTAADTADSIQTAIEGNLTISALVTVSVVGNIITLTAVTAGVAGNALTLAYTDSGSGVAVTLSGATLAGGVDLIPAADISNLQLYVRDYRQGPVLNPDDFGTAAVISVDDNSLITGDTVTIGTVALVEGVDFTAGGSAAATAAAIKAAIDGNATLAAIVDATVVGDTVEVQAKTRAEVLDGRVSVIYTDSGSGVAVTVTGYLDQYTTVSLTSGDAWIVPEGALGTWFVAPPSPFDDKTVNTATGKKATWDGTSWTFTFASFASFEFGFVAPVDIVIGEETLVQSYVRPGENVFEPPVGIEFDAANGSDNAIVIGDLPVGNNLGLWIKRIVAKYDIVKYDLDVDQGGIVLDEVTTMVFSYDTP